MPDDNQNFEREGRMSLSFTHREITYILGTSLAHLYREVLQTQPPPDLQALITQLERLESGVGGEEARE
jgi:hypothetical protein